MGRVKATPRKRQTPPNAHEAEDSPRVALDLEAEEDEELELQVKKPKLSNCHHNRRLFAIDCWEKPVGDHWILISTWALMAVSDIEHLEVQLFIQDGYMTCLCTNPSNQTRQVCRSKVPHQVQVELKSGLKRGTLSFQAHLQYPRSGSQEGRSSLEHPRRTLALNMFARMYPLTQQGEVIPSFTTREAYFNFYLSRELLQWMLGEDLCTSVSTNNEGQSFSLPLFLRQISDRPRGDCVSQSNKQGGGTEEEVQTTEHSLHLKLQALGMLPSLRPYQLQAILWMMRREGRQIDKCMPLSLERITASTQGFVMLPSSHCRRNYRAVSSRNNLNATEVLGIAKHKWEFSAESGGITVPMGGEGGKPLLALQSSSLESEDDADTVVWFNILTGKAVVVRNKDNNVLSGDSHNQVNRSPSNNENAAVAHVLQSCAPLVSGGMLCDEPGLGKTLEVLGLILVDKDKCTFAESCHHPAPDPAPGRGSTTLEGEEQCMPLPHMTEGATTTTTTATASADVACVCMRTSYRPKLHLGWVQCDDCDRYCHITCAGFASVQEAELCAHYRCQVCACSALAPCPMPAPGTTLIVVPFNLIGQWCREIDKHFASGSLSYTVYEGYKFLQHGGVRTSAGNGSIGEGKKGKRKCSPQKDYEAANKIDDDDSPPVKIASTLPMRVADMHPERLARFDIVLTSFEVIAAELARTESPYATGSSSLTNVKFFDSVDLSARGLGTKTLRREKKYRVSPSPLACLHWHRVCLDEAQLVEGTATAAAQMASKLHTLHRWCVSGTPVGKGRLQDLQGLFSFLRQAPVGEVSGWRELIEKPIHQGDAAGMSRLINLSHQLVLRRTKKGIDAKGQLRLPKQREIVNRLEFSAVEAHFYQQQFEESSRSIRNFMKNSSTTATVTDTAGANTIIVEEFDSSSSSSCGPSGQPLIEQAEEAHDPNSTATAEMLSNTLLTLRQAACHPQLGARGLGGRSHTHGGTKGRRLGGRGREEGEESGLAQVTNKGMAVLTMDQILFKLIDEAKLKCEESQRKLLMQMAASAGVYQIQAELSACNATQNNATFHFLSKARGVYAEAVRTYETNRRACLVLGMMTVSSLPQSLSPPLHSKQSASALEQINGGGSYSCRANEVSMCWTGTADEHRHHREEHTLSIDQLIPSLSEKSCSGPSVLGCQLDNSSVSTATASNRRILRVKYRVDIEQAIHALLTQRGGVIDCTISSRYQRSKQEDLNFSLEAVEHLGTIYFPSKITFQTSGSGSIFVNSHSFESSAPKSSSGYAEKYDSGVFRLQNSYRSKSWRVLIESVHGTGLAVVLSKQNSISDGRVHVIPNYKYSPHNDSSAMSSNWAVALSCELHEAEFDIDLLQEIHLTSNYHKLIKKSVSQQPPQDQKQQLREAQQEDVDGKGVEGGGFSTPSRDKKTRMRRDEFLQQSPSAHQTMKNTGTVVHLDFDQPEQRREEGACVPSLATELSERSTLLSNQYISAAQAIRDTARIKAAETVHATDALYASFCAAGGWEWVHVLMQCLSHSTGAVSASASQSQSVDGDELLDSVRRVVDGNGQAYVSLSPHLHSCAALAGIFVDTVADLESHRQQATRGVLSLPYSPSETEIAENSNCKKCRQDWGKQGRVCRHCKLEGVVLAYQGCVFAYRKHSSSQKKSQQALSLHWEGDEGDEDDDGLDGGGGGCFEVEGVALRLTRLLHRFLHKLPSRRWESSLSQLQGYVPSGNGALFRQQADCNTCSIDVSALRLASDKCLAYLEALQREVLPLKALWKQHLHCFSALDELQSAKVPMQLLRLDTIEYYNNTKHKKNKSLENEPYQENLQGYVVEGEESSRQEECCLSVVACTDELKKTSGQLQYLKNMAFSRLGIANAHAGNRTSDGGNVGQTGRCTSRTEQELEQEQEPEQEQAQSNTPEAVDCVVCMESLTVIESTDEGGGEGGGVCVLPCGHEFHRECVDWILERSSSSSSSSKRRKKQLKCPVCRVVSAEEDIIQAIAVRNSRNQQISAVTPPVPISDSASHATNNTDIGPNTSRVIYNSERSRARVKGDWGAKLTAVVSDLLDLKHSGSTPASTTEESSLKGEQHADSVPKEKENENDNKTEANIDNGTKRGCSNGFDIKSIVFSQWDQMLDMCAAALQRNGIAYEKIGGQGSTSKRHFERSLARFQCDPFVSVLLLPLKSGAQGLTLVEATHVFFLEPLLNLEQELQAVNRIHRIGQECETCVHKYIMRNTVEEQIHRLYEERVREEAKLQLSLDLCLSNSHGDCGDEDDGKVTHINTERTALKSSSTFSCNIKSTKRRKGDHTTLTLADMKSFFM